MGPSNLMQSVYYHDIKTTFSRICPDLNHDGKMSTRTKQDNRLKPPGLTIVARINREKEERPFMEAIKKIQESSGKTFCSTMFLHITLLGLLNDERRRSDSLNGIIRSAKEFIEQKQIGPITIKFNLVRLGAFYDKDRRPCDCNSDGTLVALADNKSKEVDKFNILGDDLACHLRNSFPAIFYPSINGRLKREHPTVDDIQIVYASKIGCNCNNHCSDDVTDVYI